jgi:hypothetical protein
MCADTELSYVIFDVNDSSVESLTQCRPRSRKVGLAHDFVGGVKARKGGRCECGRAARFAFCVSKSPSLAKSFVDERLGRPELSCNIPGALSSKPGASYA